MRVARRFYANTESRSWNLTSGSPAAQHISHDTTPVPSRAGINERAYQSYVKFSRGLGIVPMTFAAWSRVTDRVASPSLNDAQAIFQEHYGDLRLELQDHLTARSRGIPAAPMYDSRDEVRLRHDGRQVMTTGGCE